MLFSEYFVDTAIKNWLKAHFYKKPVRFKMENEPKRNIYEQRNAKIKNKKVTVIFWM